MIRTGRPAQARQVGAVGQVLQHPGAAGGPGPGQQHRPGCVDLGQERVGVEAPVQQDEHAGAQQRQQPAGQGGLVPVGRRADGGADQGAGAGLGQGHQPQHRVPGPAHPVPDPAQPAAVAVSVGDFQGVQAVEGDRAQPAEPGPGSARLGEWPGHYLEQGSHRLRTQPAAQVAQRLLRRARQRQARQPSRQLVPDPRISKAREHRQREQEVHPGPRRQVAQPPLHCPGLLQDIVDELERQVLRQLAGMARGKDARGRRDGMSDRDRGTLGTQRGLWKREDRDGLTRSTRGPVSHRPATPARPQPLDPPPEPLTSRHWPLKS